MERLAYSSRVLVTGDRGRWIEIRTQQGRTGFLPVESVERDSEKDGREKRAKEILSFPAVFGVVSEDTDVLLAPFPLAARAGRVRKGTAVEIHAVDHDFYAFRTVPGGIAFVNSGDVDLIPPDPRRPAIVSEPARALKDVKLTDLNRSEPSPSDEALEPGPSDAEPPRGEELAPPVLLAKVDPLYPDSARRAGVEGTVVLEARISETGKVMDVQVVRGLPLGLSEAAAEAVHHWQYRPARGRNGPIPSRKTIRIVFTLGD